MDLLDSNEVTLLTVGDIDTTKLSEFAKNTLSNKVSIRIVDLAKHLELVRAVVS
jgi:hypothetical protein